MAANKYYQANKECGDDNDCPDNFVPFEWLTSPASIVSLLIDEVGLSQTPRMMTHRPTLRVLHVGSGTSILGELLAVLQDDRWNHNVVVVNADKDQQNLLRMKHQWNRFCERQQDSSLKQKVSFCHVDFAKQQVPYPDGSFDLVLDKSTLDCILCSHNEATAALLLQVYRSLKPQGGRYILISFHNIGLLMPLLRDLPGAQWQVDCKQITRHVETAVSYTLPSNLTPCTPTTTPSKPLNVLIAKRHSHHERDSALSLDAAIEHVRNVSNTWFQQQHPILTPTRVDELQTSFATPLPLPTAFQALFTPQEKEHLTYEHFLQDWEAFSSSDAYKYDPAMPQVVTLDLAIQFLKEMQ